MSNDDIKRKVIDETLAKMGEDEAHVSDPEVAKAYRLAQELLLEVKAKNDTP